MTIVLTLLTIINAAALLYYPVPAEYLGAVRIAALLLPCLLLISLLVTSGGRRKQPAGPAQKIPEAQPEQAAAVQSSVQDLSDAAVVRFLARLQEKGRFVDFAMDDITPYSDEQIGAAARVVHQGCTEVLKDYFHIVPIHQGEEQDQVTLAGEYDSARFRLIGHVPDAPPYRGTLLHRGWLTDRVNLPQVTADSESARTVIAPAEIEI